MTEACHQHMECNFVCPCANDMHMDRVALHVLHSGKSFTTLELVIYCIVQNDYYLA